MNSNFLALYIFNYIKEDSVKNIYFQSPIISMNKIDWVEIIINGAIAAVAITALVMAFFQRKEAIRAYRISLLSMLLQQLNQLSPPHKTEEIEYWLKAIKNLIAKWAPQEFRDISNEIQKIAKKDV